MFWQKIEVETKTGENGSLTVIDFEKQISFIPKRTFWVRSSGTQAIRGHHAHRTGHQALFCLQGVVDLRLDNGAQTETHTLVPGGFGIWMPPMVWGEQFFRDEGAVLLVLASNEYDESDYIRDKATFLQLVTQVS